MNTSMKLPTVLTVIFAALMAAATARAAKVSVQLTKVHLCCDSCVDGVDDAVSPVKGAESTADKDAKTITITGPDKDTLQKAVDALVDAGYFGVSSDPEIKVSTPGVKAGNVHLLKVSDVHLCCKKCVTSFNKALAGVPGVKTTTAVPYSPTIEVTGDFDAGAAVAALNQAGFSCKVE